MKYLLRTGLLLSLASLFLLSGCGINTRHDKLQQTLFAYHKAIRWDGFMSAAKFIDPLRLQNNPITSLEKARYRQIRVASYNEAGDPVRAKDKAYQSVRIGLVNRHTQQERFIIDNQTWHWDKEANRWWLESGLPDITASPVPNPLQP